MNGWCALVAAGLAIATAGIGPSTPAWAAPAPGVAVDGASESVRMQRAKDLISEDRWVAAIAELRQAADDPKEQSRDEALFWLAHSQNQAGDLAEAVDTIRRLQREFAHSRWSAPAYSLLLELAQKLGRRDVLWRMVPPAPPKTPMPPSPATRGSRSGSRRTPPPAPPSLPPPPPVSTAQPETPPALPAPATTWVAESYLPDTDLRIQALGRLIRTDANKVIPILGNIALEGGNTGAARRALFVLARSRHPDAQSVIADVAKRGPEPVRLAAVRELGQFKGENVSRQLLQLYSTANMPVKQQVVLSLGQRADTEALLKIAQSERDAHLRDAAIVTLGRAGGGEQLRRMYASGSRSVRHAVINGLFNARDDEGLIAIAGQERDRELRKYVFERLRLMGTPRARAYLEKSR